MQRVTPDSMRGIFLPGDREVILKQVPVPELGPRQVLVRMRASTICGSDIRAIYRDHLGEGAEAYRDVIAGHEPCGEIVAAGPGCLRFGVGDRVVVYHIAGCGLCADCRAGYMVSCTSPRRAAYGWQRDGGHADLLLAEESTCVPLPKELSFLDGACVACGFGTAYEALSRLGVCGSDTLLVSGLGPVGLAAGLLGRALGASKVIGTDISEARRELALELGAVDIALAADPDSEPASRIAEVTAGEGCEASIDCSGAPAGRRTALVSTRRWGRCAFVGEGGTVEIEVSSELIHRQISLFGSWVTSIGRMESLLELLVGWELHPERTVTHRFGLEEGEKAYRVADGEAAGKVALVMGES
jgi:threonine dehydrogenase-like Zn-dependent dehydrogenase